MKSARIERADGTERSYLFFRGAEADGCRIREAAVKHRTDYFKKKGNSLVSKKRTFKELCSCFRKRNSPKTKPKRKQRNLLFKGNEAENAAAAVQHENAYAKLGKAFINRLHLPNELIANAAEVESIVNRIISVWEKVEAKTADSAAEENAEESFEDAADANAERLPLPLAGGLAQAPEADYETMSAEQFRTLRKQLKRAAMDGRRIRL